MVNRANRVDSRVVRICALSSRGPSEAALPRGLFDTHRSTVTAPLDAASRAFAATRGRRRRGVRDAGDHIRPRADRAMGAARWGGRLRAPPLSRSAGIAANAVEVPYLRLDINLRNYTSRIGDVRLAPTPDVPVKHDPRAWGGTKHRDTRLETIDSLSNTQERASLRPTPPIEDRGSLGLALSTASAATKRQIRAPHRGNPCTPHICGTRNVSARIGRSGPALSSFRTTRNGRRTLAQQAGV